MGKRNKRIRLEGIKNFDNVFDGDFVLSESWKDFTTNHLGNLVLELGCGKGKYTTALAHMFTVNNYVGMDRKGERLWVGAKYAAAWGLSNVRFLRGDANNILEYFGENTVHEIWVTFPDPFPRKKQAKHRLTAPGFLEIYKKVLVKGGYLHLKTDDEALFEYSLDTFLQSGGKVVKALANIYQEESLDPVIQIQTDFEKKHLANGKKIYYIQAQF